LPGCAGAVAAASPASVNLSRVMEMWTAAMKAGKPAKEAALHSALGVLASPPPPVAHAAVGERAAAQADRQTDRLRRSASPLDCQRMFFCPGRRSCAGAHAGRFTGALGASQSSRLPHAIGHSLSYLEPLPVRA
jgi:hypothetical protein